MLVKVCVCGGGGGGFRPLIVYCDHSYAMGISTQPTWGRGVGGHAPQENFGNLDSVREFLRHPDSKFS